MNAADLWADSADVAKNCLEHPFIVGIRDGDLPKSSFSYFIGQDAFFLSAFARGYATAVATAPTEDLMRTFKQLLDGVFDELEMHRSFAAEWDIDLAPEPAPATLAYTDFLQRVAGFEPLGNLCAAMAPCMRLYAHLGQRVAPDTADSSIYHPWVTQYASDEMEELASTLEQLLDTLGGDQDELRSRYRQAMRLELQFFDSAHLATQP